MQYYDRYLKLPNIILDLIIKLENHRAKLVSVATNAAAAGDSFGSKTIKIEDSFKDAVYEIKPDPTFYFNLGVSFNPFTLLGKKK